MVQQFPAAAAYPALRNSILPWAISRSGWLATHGFEHLGYFSSEFCISVQDHVIGRAVVGEGLAELLYYPAAGRMLRGVEMNDPPPVMANHKEAIQNTESGRGDCKEVHPRNRFAMIPQEDPPTLPRIPLTPNLSQVPRDGPLRNLQAKFP